MSKDSDKVRLVIPPPNFETATFTIEGTAPYVQNKMSAKARDSIKADQEAGQAAKNKKNSMKNLSSLLKARSDPTTKKMKTPAITSWLR